MTHIELYREDRIIRSRGFADTYAQEHGLPESFQERTEPGDFRWRMVHTNGDLVGASTQGYADKRDMIWNLKFVTGCRMDHGGEILKRRVTIGRVFAWQKFEVRDLTKGDS